MTVHAVSFVAVGVAAATALVIAGTRVPIQSARRPIQAAPRAEAYMWRTLAGSVDRETVSG